MEFRFINEFSASGTDEIVDYLSGPRLYIPRADYPNLPDWLQKVYVQLKAGSKRAMVAFFGREIAGAVIYQKHTTFPETLEIKNITVRPDMRGRYIASFLVRNAEVEGAQEFGSQFVVCDAKAENRAIGLFLARQHYQIAGREDIYKLGTGEDLIFKKPIIPQSAAAGFRFPKDTIDI